MKSFFLMGSLLRVSLGYSATLAKSDENVKAVGVMETGEESENTRRRGEKAA
jgi:hypothetical protein